MNLRKRYYGFGKRFASLLITGVVVTGQLMGSAPVVSTAADPSSSTSRISGEIKLDPQNRYQTMEGWGSTIAWWGNTVGTWGDNDFNENGTPDREELAYLAFSPEELNLNIVRYNVGGGDDPDKTTIKRVEGAVPGWSTDMFGSYDGGDRTAGTNASVSSDFYDKDAEDMADAGQLWLLGQANKYRKEAADAAGTENDIINKVFANSPPYYMTNSGRSTGNISGSNDNLKDTERNAFTEYLATASNWIDGWLSETYDTGVDVVEPMNEPNTSYWSAGSQKQEGNHVTPGTNQSLLMSSMQNALDTIGLDNVKLTGTDEFSLAQGMTNFNSLSDEVKLAEDLISVHTYGNTDSDRISLRDLSAQYDQGLWMSEVCMGGGPHNPDSFSNTNSKDLSKGIMNDLNKLEPTAWIAWLVVDSEYECLQCNENWGLIHAVFEEDGPVSDFHTKLVDEQGQKLDDVPDYGEWHISKQFYTMKQYSKYIKSGYTIIDIADDNMVAAISPDQDEVVIVAQNFDSSRSTSIDLNDFENAGTAELYRTSESENCKLVKTADVSKGVLDVNLPANSVSTYVITAKDGGSLRESTGYYRTINSEVYTPNNASAVGADDMDKFTYSGTWSKSSVTGAYSGAVRRAAADNASAVFTFEGDRAVILGQKYSSGGTFNVTVDGESKGTVNTSLATAYPNAVLFDTGELSGGTHAVVITKSGSGGYVCIGAAQIVYGDVDFSEELQLDILASHDESLTVEFQQAQDAAGYEIYCGTDPENLTLYTAATEAKPVSITGLTNGETYYVKVVAAITEGTAESRVVSGVPNLPEKPYYFVNAGMSSNYLLREGDSFGRYSSSLEQKYGADPITGKMWGYDDGNELSSGNSGSDRWSSVRTDEQNTEGRGLTYTFELPEGRYAVTLGIRDPWSNGGRKQDVVIQGQTKLSSFVPGNRQNTFIYGADVGSDNELTIEILRSAGNTGSNEDPLINFIIIEDYDEDAIVNLEIPETIFVAQGTSPKLPSAFTAETLGGEKVSITVNWNDTGSIKTTEAYSTFTVYGSLEDGTEVSTNLQVIPAGIMYLIDCNHLSSPIHAMLLSSGSAMKNQAADQAYNSTDGWGRLESYGGYSSSNADLYSAGWYAYNNQSNIQYKVTLQPGTYTATFGAKEWWGNQNRIMKVFAEGDGTTDFESLSTGNFTIGASGGQTAAASTQFKLTTPMEITLKCGRVSSTGNDPVLSWISVKQDFATNALVSLVNEAAGKTPSNYTSSSWNALESARMEANDTLIKASSQSEINSAASDLQTALNDLVSIKDLSKKLSEAKAIERGNYADDKWNALQNAITSAEDVLSNGSATQVEVNNALQGLRNAITDLGTIEERLQEKLTEAKAITRGDYTDASWNALQSAIINAEEVLDTGSATQDEKEAAYNTLLNAIAGLEVAPVTTQIINNKLTEAKAIARGDNTDTSWNALQSAIADVEEVLGKGDDATQAEKEAAYNALLNAIAGLTEAPVTTQMLSDKMAEAKATSRGDYTDASWKTLQDAIAAAEEVLDKGDDAAQTEKETVYNSLQAAIAGLETADITKQALADKVSESGEITKGLYTEESWKTLQDAIAAAGKVLDKGDNATQKEVEDAYTILQTAIDGLTLITVNVPTNLNAAKASATSIKVSWDAANDIDGYEVWYFTSQIGNYSLLNTLTGTSYTHEGLTIGNTYNYKVCAYKKVDGVIYRSGFTTIKSIQLPVPTPTNIKAVSAGARSIKVSWQKVTGADGYQIWRSTKRNGSYTKIKTAATNTSSYTDKNLTNKKTYYYKVKAYRKVDGKDVESKFSTIAGRKAALSKPAGVTAKKAGKGAIKISWKKVAGAKKYEIYRSAKSNGKYKKIATVKSNKLSYSNKKLTSGKKYYYKVKAVQKIGKKTYRSVFSAKKYARVK